MQRGEGEEGINKSEGCWRDTEKVLMSLLVYCALSFNLCCSVRLETPLTLRGGVYFSQAGHLYVGCLSAVRDAGGANKLPQHAQKIR